MIIVYLLLVAVGLTIVVFSADEAIKRLLNLARFFNFSEFVISFVLAGVIAILPELSIGVLAAIEGTSSLGFGVILGANVADLTLVIGVVALFAGNLRLTSPIIKNIRLAFLAVLLPVFLFIDGEISRIDGGILILAFIFYLIVLLRTKHDRPGTPSKKPKRRYVLELSLLILSLALLFVGGALITENSQELSLSLGLPLFVVGAIVAIGTCLPEMAFAVRASRRQHGHLGLGNIMGNVLADSLLTIGVIALIQPIKPAIVLSPMVAGIIMAISSLVVYVLSRDGVLDRKDGIILVTIYAVFIAVQSFIVGVT